MRRLIISLLSLVILFQVSAQYDPQALQVLDAMSSKYRKIVAFKAEFSQQLINESAGLDETISGQIAVKGAMYVLDVSGQRIFNNGIDMFNYNPEIKEVTISSYDPEESEINVGNVYDLYKKGFKYNLAETTASGNRIIELDPESRDKSYFKIKMSINSKDELESFTVFERSSPKSTNPGNKYVYTIKAFTPVDLSDNHFTFDVSKYPNVEVIDFR